MYELGYHRALQMTSPDTFNRKASRASNHSCSLKFVLTIAISPNRNGLTNCALLPVEIARSSLVSIKTRLLGLLTTSMWLRTGLSSRYFSVAHIRRSVSLALWKATGSGSSTVPLVIFVMKPLRRRMDRIPRFVVVCSTGTCR